MGQKQNPNAKKIVHAKLDTLTGKLTGVVIQPNLNLVEPKSIRSVRIPELSMSIKLKPGHTVREFIIRYVANNPLKKKRLYSAYSITEEHEQEVNPTKTLKGSNKGKKKEEFFEEKSNWK